MKVFVGIDLGSTTTKAVSLDERRQVVGRGITNSRSNYDVACAVVARGGARRTPASGCSRRRWPPIPTSRARRQLSRRPLARNFRLAAAPRPARRACASALHRRGGAAAATSLYAATLDQRSSTRICRRDGSSASPRTSRTAPRARATSSATSPPPTTCTSPSSCSDPKRRHLRRSAAACSTRPSSTVENAAARRALRARTSRRALEPHLATAPAAIRERAAGFGPP